MDRLTKRNSDGSVGINAFRYYNYQDFQKLAAKLADYEQIGTVEEFKELKEKSTAKKPTLVTRGFIKFYHCPYCSTPEKYIQVYPKQKHCVECGQKLDWN